MSKQDILLRTVVNAPLTTKGSKLTSAEVDGNFIDIYNALVEQSQSSHVDAYSAAISYLTGEYVLYANQLYKQISATPQINITPGSVPALLVWLPVYASDLVQAPNGIKTFKKTITSAEVLQLFTTPIELVAAAGADKAIQLLNGNVTVLFNEGSPSGTPYATNINLLFGYTGGTKALFTREDTIATDIKQTMPLDQYIDPVYAKSTDYILENAGLIVTTQTGNPTTGDSDLLIQGTYKEIDLV